MFGVFFWGGAPSFEPFNPVNSFTLCICEELEVHQCEGHIKSAQENSLLLHHPSLHFLCDCDAVGVHYQVKETPLMVLERRLEG